MMDCEKNELPKIMAHCGDLPLFVYFYGKTKEWYIYHDLAKVDLLYEWVSKWKGPGHDILSDFDL